MGYIGSIGYMGNDGLYGEYGLYGEGMMGNELKITWKMIWKP